MDPEIEGYAHFIDKLLKKADEHAASPLRRRPQLGTPGRRHQLRSGHRRPHVRGRPMVGGPRFDGQRSWSAAGHRVRRPSRRQW